MDRRVTLLHGNELVFDGQECTSGQLDVYNAADLLKLLEVVYVLDFQKKPYVLLSGTEMEITAILSLMLDGEAVSESPSSGE